MSLSQKKPYSKPTLILHENKENKFNLKGNTFDETWQKHLNNLSSLFIYSDVPVNLKASTTDKISAHLHGDAPFDVEIEVDFNCFKTAATICTKFVNVVYDHLFFHDFVSERNLLVGIDIKIDIEIPMKLYEEITIKSPNTTINIPKSIEAKTINIYCNYGSIMIKSPFKELCIHSNKADILVDSHVKENPKFDINDHNGLISIWLPKVDTSQICTEALNGKCSNPLNLNKSGTCKYIATGSIKTHTGSISIH